MSDAAPTLRADPSSARAGLCGAKFQCWWLETLLFRREVLVAGFLRGLRGCGLVRVSQSWQSAHVCLWNGASWLFPAPTFPKPPSRASPGTEGCCMTPRQLCSAVVPEAAACRVVTGSGWWLQGQTPYCCFLSTLDGCNLAVLAAD